MLTVGVVLNFFNNKAQLLFPPVVLVGMLLFPHGVGYRFSIGHLDIPRLIVLTVVFCWVSTVIFRWFKSREISIDKCALLPGTLAILVLFSAIFSSSPIESFALASKLCLLWFVFPIAYVSSINKHYDYERLNQTLVLIFVVLSLFALYEVVFQRYLFPLEMRTSFSNAEGYEWFVSKTLFRSDTILAQGPFLWNHTLSGLCVAGSGLAIFALDRSNRLFLFGAYGFFMLLIAAGTRAGYLSVLIAYILFGIWSCRVSHIVHFCLASFISEIGFLGYTGNHAPVFFTGDISGKWVREEPSMARTFYEFNSLETGFSAWFSEFFSNLGPVTVKLMGFMLNLSQIDKWWLVGFGFGAFQREQSIPSEAIQYDDPGLIQLIFLESGIPAGFLLLFILLKAAFSGLRDEVTKFYSIGILAWIIFALSSWETWSLSLCMIFVLIISKRQNCQAYT